MSELPKAAIERLIRNAGAERVSATACEALAEVLEGVAMDLAAEASMLAKHAGRKTVTDEDIKLAAKR